MMRRSGPSGWAGRSPVRWPAELLTGVGFAVIIAATVVAAIIFGPHQPVGRLTVLAVAVARFAAVAGDLLAALATVVIGWLFLNGMLIDQHAVLRWHGTADVVRLMVLAGAALAGTACAWLARLHRAGPLQIPGSAVAGMADSGDRRAADPGPWRPGGSCRPEKNSAPEGHLPGI